MNDYRELIECLKIRSENNRDGGFWNEGVSDNIDAAIKAIEQLVKERDGWMIAYDGAQRAYHEWFAEAQKLMKERDAAIKDLKYLPFTTCKWVNTDRCKNSCLCEKFEWRGVQNDT